MAEIAEDDRIAWANKMRLLLSPTGSVEEDGSIKQDFFKPKRARHTFYYVVYMTDKAKWGDDEKNKLYKGLEQYGIGQWREIRANLLPDWDEQALRIKASRLMGSQSLARYPNWKGNRAAVDAQRDLNKAIGDRTGCWKAGVLVENDAGSVAKALAEMEAA